MSEPGRDALIARFLARNGYDAGAAAPLAQDASFRRYLRLKPSGTKPGAVLMDAPPPEDVRPFLAMAAHLSNAGLSVPAILGADADNGLVLEEDLGDSLYSAVLTGANAHALLDAAIDALAVMQRAAPPPGLPTWGAPEMRETALGTLFDWWWPAIHGAPAPPAAREAVAAGLTDMLVHVEQGPRCLVHRDYFAGNLLWLADRQGHERAGIIDFQGAAIGHPAYDLASLLQDARRDMPEAWEGHALARYLAARPELDAGAFLSAYTACAAQRHLRVACQWVRLAVRDNRPAYLAHGPRTWALLTRALAEPAAAPLAAALDAWAPRSHRRNPPGLRP